MATIRHRGHCRRITRRGAARYLARARAAGALVSTEQGGRVVRVWPTHRPGSPTVLTLPLRRAPRVTGRFGGRQPAELAAGTAALLVMFGPFAFAVAYLLCVIFF